MKTTHCIYCTKSIEINQRGRLKPHMNGNSQCIGSGFIATQIAEINKLYVQNNPGAELVKKFSK